jgi:hypothetical protein
LEETVMNRNASVWLIPLASLWCATCASGASPANARVTINLDGTWQIAEGKMDQCPAQFSHTVPVPGLADLASPPFDTPGATVSAEERRKPGLRPADPRREAFWYRRTFRVEQPLPAAALLKVSKARYGTQVYLNGQVVGEHQPCFTPGWFDVRKQLQSDGTENELVIRVGASMVQLPPHVNGGFDFEKSRYIPGIFDSVELVLTGSPYIANVQAVPQVDQRSVQAVVELSGTGSGGTTTPVKLLVREFKSRTVVGEATAESSVPEAGKVNTVTVNAPVREPHLWTPEDPFLYELEVTTSGDSYRTRFGLRSFQTDPSTGLALLNGNPYYLRGSNVCIYRFFEDAARGNLPWDREWVRQLHRRFKDMHWNSLRYCIGFPPEFWYDIADEEGILIQDEFPIWYGGAKDSWPKAIQPEHLAVEYREWMRERWNHPCVVIWDAQNETTEDAVIAAAMKQVRGLDVSRRPWDNGWGTPQQPGDISEGHPYRSSKPGFRLGGFAAEDGIPNNGPRQGAAPPYLINEYGWLWINRDGTLPTLTVDVYKRVLGENASVEARREYYARMLTAKTEFWRVRRKCCGVLHFCGLGYSRPDGQTSDNFIDVKNLTYEPHFLRFVRDAFAPVGVAIDFWQDEAARSSAIRVPVRVINDLGQDWSGTVALRAVRNGQTIFEQQKEVRAAKWQLGSADFDVTLPTEDGLVQLVGEIRGADGQPIRSLRDVHVRALPDPPGRSE